MSEPGDHSKLLPIVRAIRKRTSLILLYHGLGVPEAGHDPENLQVAPGAFRRQLSLLIEAGFSFVTVAELAARIVDGQSPPPGLVALSFDDGMEDNHSVLAPILAAHGVPATIYVVTGVIGRPNPWMDPAAATRMMDSSEIRELADAGFEIGAHTVTHPDLRQLAHEACMREMVESKGTLEAIVERPVKTFAYPFGHYGPGVIRAAEAAGFEAAVTCVNRGSWARFELQRRLITGRDGPVGFVLRAAGLYEPIVLGRVGAIVRRATGTLRGRT